MNARPIRSFTIFYQRVIAFKISENQNSYVSQMPNKVLTMLITLDSKDEIIGNEHS